MKYDNLTYFTILTIPSHHILCEKCQDFRSDQLLPQLWCHMPLKHLTSTTEVPSISKCHDSFTHLHLQSSSLLLINFNQKTKTRYKVKRNSYKTWCNLKPKSQIKWMKSVYCLLSRDDIYPYKSQNYHQRLRSHLGQL